MAVGSWDISILAQRTELDLEKRNASSITMCYVCVPTVYIMSGLSLKVINDTLNVNNFRLHKRINLKIVQYIEDQIDTCNILKMNDLRTKLKVCSLIFT